MVGFLTYLPNIYYFSIWSLIWFGVMCSLTEIQASSDFSDVVLWVVWDLLCRWRWGLGQRCCLCFSLILFSYLVICRAWSYTDIYHHQEESCLLRRVWALNGRSQCPNTLLICPTSFGFSTSILCDKWDKTLITDTCSRMCHNWHISFKTSSGWR